MAKRKNEKGLSYMQMPLPQGEAAYRSVKLNWSGLNRRQTTDTGVLSMENNISTAEAPYLTPSQKRRFILDSSGAIDKTYAHPISMFAFDDFLIVIYREGTKLLVDHIGFSSGGHPNKIYTGLIKSGVTSAEDRIQRSVVQFNVYENSLDVLDGVYVKKLLIFPDKVSMYMNIRDASISPYSDDAATTLDTNALQFYSNTYYAWDSMENSFVPYFASGNSRYFKTSGLDVKVKTYYNDGYTKTSDTHFNDGYKPAEGNFYNDGYAPISTADGTPTFYDAYHKQTSGTYQSADNKVYYQRIGTVSPYMYLVVSDLSDGDSVRGYYLKDQIPIMFQPGRALYNTTFYEKTAHGMTAVENLESGNTVTGYYLKSDNSLFPEVHKPLYGRCHTDRDGNPIVPYAYVQLQLDYGDSLQDAYEKISDKAVEIKSYYKRTGNTAPYTYVDVTDELQYGDSLKGLYEKTNSYAPPKGSDKSCYWQNTYVGPEMSIFDEDNRCFCWSDSAGEFIPQIPPAFPNLKYAVVHQSRLFGVDEDRVHVSGFNDYSNWNLDTVDESNESNAWSSATQTNTKAGGNFTGISLYDNHVVCFKHDFIHEIYNTKNPFRLVDVCNEGSIDNRSVQEVDGKLIFVAADEVKVYTGSNPREIGYNLGIDKFAEAVSGTDGRNYYLYCSDGNNDYFFVFDTFVGQWSQQAIDTEVLSFAHSSKGMYMLGADGKIYRLDTKDWSGLAWSFETDMSTVLPSSGSAPTVSIKHLTKFQMLAYIKSGSRLKVYALYDNEPFNANSSHLLYDSHGRNGLLPIRLKPRMTAHYGLKLHFEGTGYIRIYEMELRLSNGGELFV